MNITRFALPALAALAAPCALAALDDYTIDLKRESNGLDIVASATPGPIAAVEVRNRSEQRVRCFVDFEGERMMLTRRETWLDAGKQATVRQRIADPQITSLGVSVSCDALSADQPVPPTEPLGPIVRRFADDPDAPTPPGTDTGGTTQPPPRGTSQRTTSESAPRTDVSGAGRTTRQTGTTTVISPRPGSTPPAASGTNSAQR